MIKIQRLSWCYRCGKIFWIDAKFDGLCCACRGCDRDCEHCIYDDCVVDDITEEEAVAAENRDLYAKKLRKERI